MLDALVGERRQPLTDVARSGHGVADRKAGEAFCRDHFGPQELRSVGFSGEIEVQDVEIDGDLATVRVENVRGDRRVAGTATLRKVGDEWRLTAPPG